MSSNTLHLNPANNRAPGQSGSAPGDLANLDTLTIPTHTDNFTPLATDPVGQIAKLLLDLDKHVNEDTPIETLKTVLTIPAIPGFPELTLPVVLSLSTCDCYGYQFHEESFF